MVNTGENMKKKIDINSGDIFFIPLFLEGDPSTKSYARYNFDKFEQRFCFARIIKDLQGMGILIEVFNIEGGIDTPISKIESSDRLNNPVLVFGDGIQTKRWRKIGETKNYDLEKHSNFGQIQFRLGGIGVRIWQNHHERQSTEEEASSIDEAIVMTAWQLEVKAIEELRAANYSSVAFEIKQK